ncbi:MAG: hypothetical protein ACK4TK_07395 [Thiobacillaceae bacterium]
MAIGDKVWDAIATVIRMNDRIVAMAEQMKSQQCRIEDLTERVVRLETALEIALAGRGAKTPPRRVSRKVG